MIKAKNQCCGSGSAWIRKFCLDPEHGKFKAGSGSGINRFGSTTLQKITEQQKTRNDIPY